MILFSLRCKICIHESNNIPEEVQDTIIPISGHFDDLSKKVQMYLRKSFIPVKKHYTWKCSVLRQKKIHLYFLYSCEFTLCLELLRHIQASRTLSVHI